jgi:EAL domain-containing protein (putative c-di-GMP-specific phosphodiesterase class I)
VQAIEAILQNTGIDPGTVHFEIMETLAMGNAGRTLSMLAGLKAIGVHLSMDDFGTGYSSLSRLPKFPLDTLKIDRAFISDLTSNADSYEIVRLIIMLADSLGLKVIAEGTEHEDQIKELRKLGCEMAQGYFFAPPVDPQEIPKLLSRQSVLHA